MFMRHIIVFNRVVLTTFTFGLTTKSDALKNQCSYGYCVWPALEADKYSFTMSPTGELGLAEN